MISGLVDVGPEEPGLAVAVLRHGELIAHHCAGLSDLSNRLPIRPDTRFHIVSVSKTFMAAAVLMWFAAQAALQGGDYEFYVRAAQAMEDAAAAQGCQ